MDLIDHIRELEASHPDEVQEAIKEQTILLGFGAD